MDGVLIVDKPSGPTSHDVVAATRRALGERRIGHTGTLDPMATGVLPLACGRATRLVQFFIASDKDYEAEIRLGMATDTYDATGTVILRSERRPDQAEIAAALATLSGEYLQAPPPYSAKRIAGKRAYELARVAAQSHEGAESAVVLPPARVRVDRLELREVAGDLVSIRLTCSAGFYVRSLAHELGRRLQTGGCLTKLRRTRSGEFLIASAIALDEVVRNPAAAAAAAVPLSGLLTQYPAVTVTEEGAQWVSHGRAIGPAQLAETSPAAHEWVRLFHGDGRLLALGRPAGASGSLHPSVVLI